GAVHRASGRHRGGQRLRPRRRQTGRARGEPRRGRLRALRGGRDRRPARDDGCAAPRALLERLQRGRRVLPSDPDPGAGARSPRRPARSGNRLSGLPSCRRGLGLRGIRRPAGRDPPCAGSRVRRRGAALSALARCHALRRPETGDRVTWQLRRADAGDLESIMRLETSIFGSDAWSSGTMRDELANANTWYLVAFRPETPESIEAYAG